MTKFMGLGTWGNRVGITQMAKTDRGQRQLEGQKDRLGMLG